MRDRRQIVALLCVLGYVVAFVAVMWSIDPGQKPEPYIDRGPYPQPFGPMQHYRFGPPPSK